MSVNEEVHVKFSREDYNSFILPNIDSNCNVVLSCFIKISVSSKKITSNIYIYTALTHMQCRCNIYTLYNTRRPEENHHFCLKHVNLIHITNTNNNKICDGAKQSLPYCQSVNLSLPLFTLAVSNVTQPATYS
jgi:hypothetical protein